LELVIKMKRSRGFRSKSRSKLKKKTRKGETNIIRRALQEFEQGDKVAIVIDPSFQKGMPHPRFHGRIGNVVGMQGNAYIVRIKDGKKVKNIISSPVHLKGIT